MDPHIEPIAASLTTFGDECTTGGPACVARAGGVAFLAAAAFVWDGGGSRCNRGEVGAGTVGSRSSGFRPPVTRVVLDPPLEELELRLIPGPPEREPVALLRGTWWTLGVTLGRHGALRDLTVEMQPHEDPWLEAMELLGAELWDAGFFDRWPGSRALLGDPSRPIEKLYEFSSESRLEMARGWA